MNARLLGCAAALTLCTGGCGTIFNGTTEQIQFISYPPGATVSFLDAPEIPNIQTPATLELKRNKTYTAHFELSGHPDHDVMINSGLSGWLLGNIVFGGVLGIVVDFISGGAYDLSPNVLYIDMATGATEEETPETESGTD